MNFRYLSALCLLWATAWSLLGCGAGVASDSTHTAAIPMNVEPGVYQGTLGAKDFISVLTPASWGGQWYGLHYASSNPSIEDPNIYTGQLQDLSTRTATAPIRYFPINSSYASVSDGKATLTAPGTGLLSGDLDLRPAIPIATFNATPTTAFTFSRAADLQDIAGSWTGRLSYGAGTNGALTFTVSAGTGRVSEVDFGVDCKWTAPNFQVTADTAVNLFRLELTMSQSTSCDFSLNSMKGVAFVFNSPIAGKTQRLIWVATTPTGQGISFKADR
jgi:hypothetical protein